MQSRINSVMPFRCKEGKCWVQQQLYTRYTIGGRSIAFVPFVVALNNNITYLNVYANRGEQAQ